MRFGSGLGLLSLLITMAIILYVFAGKGGCAPGYLGAVMKVKKEKEPLVQQWGGKDTRGRPFMETLDLARWPEKGEMKGLEVTRVDQFGPAVTYFGLQTGDVILEIGMQEVGGPIIDTPGAGGDFLAEAFQKNFPIKVRRGEQELTLPSGAPPAPGTGFPQAKPSNQPGAGLENLPSRLPGGP